MMAAEFSDAYRIRNWVLVALVVLGLAGIVGAVGVVGWVRYLWRKNWHTVGPTSGIACKRGDAAITYGQPLTGG